MDQPKDTRHPIGEFDTDTENRLLPATHYRYGKNGRSGTSDKDGVGSTEGIRGNKLVRTGDVGEKVIGSCPDIKNNAVIDFIYNPAKTITFTSAEVISISPTVLANIVSPSETIYVGTVLATIQGMGGGFSGIVNGIFLDTYDITVISGFPSVAAIADIAILNYHHISRYYVNSGVTEYLTNPALLGTILNFSSTDRMYNPRIIESSFGQLLTWVSCLNGIPRLINIDKLKFGSTFYGTASSEIYVSLIKYAPPRPTIELIEASGQAANAILNNYFQFALAYVYEDGQVSTISEYSDLSLLTQDYFIGTNKTADFKNAINITFNTGYYTKKVYLFRRVGNGVSSTGANNTEWYRWKTYDVLGPNQNITQTFYNTEQLTPLSRIDSDKLFESVPLYADHIEVTDGNQIILASITEGQDPITISASGEAVFTEYEQLITSQYFPKDIKWKTAGQLDGGTNDTLDVYKQPVFPGDPNEVEVGDLISVIIIKDVGTANARIFNIDHVIVASDLVGNMLGYATWLQSELTALGIPYTYTEFPDLYEFLLGATYTYLSDMFILKSGTNYLPAYSNNYRREEFKEGALHDFLLIFQDSAYRQGPAQKLPSVYVDTLPERYPLSGSYDYQQQSIAIKFEITTQPPVYANYYTIVHRSNISKTQSFIINSITSVDNGIKINFKKAYDYLQSLNVILDFEDYGTLGTKVRFLTRKYTYASTEIANERLITTVTNTYSVGSYDSTNIEIFIPNTNLGDISEEIGVGSLFEIYLEQPSEFYFERYYGTILNPGTDGRSFDTYSSIDGFATMLLTKGDSYRYWRSYKYDVESDQDTPLYHIESLSINDYNESEFNSKGRPQIETPDYRRRKYGSVLRWGNKLINNTQVNNLSVWDEGNYNNELNARFGNITGIRQIGYTLSILQWTNISKAFLGRQELMNTDGTSNLVITDNLIGTINPSEDEWGTKHPGSICVIGRYLYFLDTIKAKVIRNAPNGNICISDQYFTKKYWRDKSILIESSTNYEIISGVDFKFNDYYITVRNTVLNPDYESTIYFNEDQNAWKYEVDMKDASGNIINWYSWVGQSLFVSIKEKMWQQNALVDGDGNPLYLNLFGDNKNLVVETIGMLDPDKVKIMLSSTVHSNIKPTLVEFFIPPNDMFPNGMYSYLKEGNYVYKEGVFYGAIKRDWFTKGVPINDAAGNFQIAEGRVLRGHVVTVRLTYTTNDYLKLFSVSTGMIPSEKS